MTIDSTVEAINKKHGKGTLIRMGDSPLLDVEAISTGILDLDLALGIGGLPRGRVVELYGPESAGKSTVAMHVVAEAQRNGGICAYIDAEHAMDPVYASVIGVDVDALLFSQPDNGEQGLEIANELAKAGGVDVIVIDSVAALTPRAEIEGDMGDSHVGLQARLMSQALRKLTGNLNNSKTLCIFINQLREKIGVMFGCVHGDTLVHFADGRSMSISKVVEEQIEGDVWAYDEDEQSYVVRPIVDWHHNGEVNSPEDWVHIKTRSIDSRGGRFGLTVTPDHQLMTPNGWTAARNITLGGHLVSKYENIINGTLGDFLWGAFVGDSHLAVRSQQTAALRLQDANDPEYLAWKVDLLAPHLPLVQRGSRYESEYRYDLVEAKKELGKRDPRAFLREHYSDLGMAVWVMDDAHYDSEDSHNRYTLSVKRFKDQRDALSQIAGLIQQRTGGTVDYRLSDGAITFDVAASRGLADRIKSYVPDCMQRKLPVEFRGRYKDLSLDCHPELKSGYVQVVEVRAASDRQMRKRGKYDLTVQGAHTYMVGGTSNGVVVHNSPEVTPGGRALKFYSSVRLDVRRIESIKNGVEVVGNRTRVKVVKNKVAPPFRQAEFDIMYGEGASVEGSVLDNAVKYEIVKKSGAWFQYGETRLGQGREKAKTFLKENPDLFEEINSKVRELFE